MDEKTINLRLHYEGQFKKTTYVGGKHLVLSAIEVESFSYYVLMEFVKDNLHYSEIGGIYANRGRKGGWQLLSNDKEVMELVEECAPGYLVNFYIDNIVDKAIEPAPQMQPHVITRPRENIIQASRKKPVKRTFVTTHQLQQQQKKMNISSKPASVCHEQDVPVKEKESAKRKLVLERCTGDEEDTRCIDVAEKLPPLQISESVKLKMDRIRGDGEETGNIDVVEKLPPPPLSEYKKMKMGQCRMDGEAGQNDVAEEVTS